MSLEILITIKYYLTVMIGLRLIALHRIVNNVGYKKIYPMSSCEDDTFCHYCGRKASIELALHWDHVPALNVKIPPELVDIRKTLVRSCNECNLIASDVPHLDYKERHFWLKESYLIRYRTLLLAEGGQVGDVSHLDSYLTAVTKNENIRYLNILSAIGFGISSIADIESPILERKNVSGKKIKDVLSDHLYCPYSLEDEDEDEAPPLIDEDEAISIYEFIEFMMDERHDGNLIIDELSYFEWRKRFAYKLNLIALPSRPEIEYNWSWDELAQCTDNALSYECKRLKKPILLAVDEVIAEKEAVYCKWVEFVETIALLQLGEPWLGLTQGLDYQKWFSNNLEYALRLDLPRMPDKAYKKTWTDIESGIYQMMKVIKSENVVNYDEDE